jgi:hypothetical protein
MYFILSLMLLGLSASPSWAGKVPEEINYQGNLREKGVPMNKDVDAFFRITNASGSKVYWSSDAIQKVKVVYGNFSVLLKPTGVKWDDIEDPHLEVVINQEVLLPREPLRSSVYSLVSGRVADGNITTASLDPDLFSRVIPSGAIMMFATACPQKWTRLSEMDGRFPRGGTSYNLQGGTTTHRHEISDSSLSIMLGIRNIDYDNFLVMRPSSKVGSYAEGTAQGWYGFTNSMRNPASSGSNKSDVSVYGPKIQGNSNFSDSIPPYMTVIFCKKD